MIARRTRVRPCQNCHVKHVKCDNVRPQCGECFRRNIECQAQGTELKWIRQDPSNVVEKRIRKRHVDRLPEIPGTPGTPESFSSRFRSQSLSPRSRSRSRNRMVRTPSKQRGIHMYAPSVRSADSPPLQSTPVTFIYSSCEIGDCVQFTLRKLFYGVPSANQAHMPNKWFASILSLPAPPKLIHSAVQCLALAYTGVQRGSTQLLNEAKRLYVQVLPLVREKLIAPCKPDDHIVLAVTAFFLYETITNSEKAPWRYHGNALSTITELLGPSYFQEGLAHETLIANRTLLIIHSLLVRKSTFLAREEWRTTPWDKVPGGKTIDDELVDISTEIPGLHEQFDQAICPEAVLTAPSLSSVLEKVKTLQTRLEGWHQRFTTLYPTYGPEEISPSPYTRVSFDDEGPIFDKVYHFDSFHAAGLHISYYTIAIILHSAPEDELDLSTTLRASPYAKYCAIEICKALEYLLYQYHAHLATFQVSLPLLLVQAVLGRDSRESVWLSSYRRSAAGSMRLRIADAWPTFVENLAGLPFTFLPISQDTPI